MRPLTNLKPNPLIPQYRADVRVNLGMLEEAREDYAAAIKQLARADAAGELNDEGTFCIGLTDDEQEDRKYCVYIPSPSDL